MEERLNQQNQHNDKALPLIIQGISYPEVTITQAFPPPWGLMLAQPFPANLVNNATAARSRRQCAPPMLHQRSSGLSSGAAPGANNPGAGCRLQGATPRHHQPSGGLCAIAAPWANSPEAEHRQQLLRPGTISTAAAFPTGLRQGLTGQQLDADGPAISEHHQCVSVVSKTQQINPVMKTLLVVERLSDIKSRKKQKTHVSLLYINNTLIGTQSNSLIAS